MSFPGIESYDSSLYKLREMDIVYVDLSTLKYHVTNRISILYKKDLRK